MLIILVKTTDEKKNVFKVIDLEAAWSKENP